MNKFKRLQQYRDQCVAANDNHPGLYDTLVADADAAIERHIDRQSYRVLYGIMGVFAVIFTAVLGYAIHVDAAWLHVARVTLD